MGIGEVGDIHTYADKVMWPALLKDQYPRDPDGDEDDLAFFTPTELAVRMDTFDWTAGISFKWNRVIRVDGVHSITGAADGQEILAI